jgi:glucosylceramidase
MNISSMNKYKFFPLIFSILLSVSFALQAQTVNSWVTNANQSALIQPQAAVNFSPGTGPTITVNAATTYQTIDGYGFTLTEGSAEAINALNATQQTNLLNELFNTSTGAGISVLRISIGASDLSSSAYSYNDGGVDVNQNNFSLAGPDLTYLIPLIKRILLINPTIKILATPWSAPRWMKTNNAWIGGSLNTAYYASYATYFVKYINAMKAQGINTWAITPQNEPENPYNEPSMLMNASEQTTFINNNLGPAFQNAGFTTKIIAFDHNCDNTAYPIQVLNNSGYVDGAAFHLYVGNISAMTDVHNATNKNVYFTEQYTSTTGGFAGDFPWHMQNVMIGSMNNWSKTALEWNLATDGGFGPRTPGGCSICLGGVTINNSNSYTKNVSYYVVAQLSKFVKAGAVRIASSTSNGSLPNVAFRNPDGSIVLVIFNNGGSQTFTVGSGANTFSYTLAGSSAVSLVWNPAVPASTGIVTTYADCNNAGFSGGFTTGDYTQAQMQAIGVPDNSISSVTVKPGYKVIVYEFDNFTGASYTITSDVSCLPLVWNDRVSSLRVLPNGVTGLGNTYYIQNKNSGLFLHPSGELTPNGTAVVQHTSLENNNQQFTFTDTGDGVYKIIGVKSGRSLDIEGAGTDQGRVLQIWDYYPTATNQHFIVAPVGDGFYKLIPRHTNQLVEVKDASFANDARVQQWNDNGQTCGQWKFIPVTTPGTGTGLAANYFNGMNFETLKYSRTDANINFDWGLGSPDASVNADQFSTRWTGQIQPKYSGDYTFYLNSDNGRRLWINNQLIIDQWIDNFGVEYSGTITLVAGQKYEIKVEYFENNGGAGCKLEWSSFLQTREVVPQTQLYANPLPTVSITSPANNAGFTAPAGIVINATAGDEGSIAKVDFYNGNTFIGTDPTFPYSFTWTNVASGTYTLTALATDNRGGVTLSSGVIVKVNQAPTVSILTPSNNATYVSVAAVNFTASAADTDGSVTKVEYYNGATLIGSATAVPYSFSWTNLGAGSYTITAKATDNLNAVTTSTAITVIVNGNQLPTVSITSPANNATFTSPATVSIAATAADNDGTVTKVEFYNGATLLGFDLTAPYSYSWTGVTAGSYPITAKAIDDKTGTTTSSVVNITVSNPNQAPTVSILTPSNNATYVSVATVNFTASAADADGSVSKVEYYNGTTLIGSATAVPYSFSWTNVGAGNYTITAKATDNLNAVTTSSAITVIVNGNQLPTVSITSPANNATFTSPATVSIAATAADNDGTVTKVEFYNGATLLGFDLTSPYTYSWTGVTAGSYVITAKAIDDKTGTTTSSVVNITVSNPNQAPTVSITSPTSNDAYKVPANVSIVASAQDANGSIAKVEFYNGVTKLGEDPSEPYMYDWTDVAEGMYELTVVAFDDQGVTTTSSVFSLVVDAALSTSIDESSESGGMMLFPNPVSDELSIASTLDLSLAAFKLMDVMGRTVMQGEHLSSKINLTTLEAGVYVLVVTHRDRRFIKSIIKN